MSTYGVYVDNAKFHQYLIEYKETPTKPLIREISKMFLLIVENLLKKPNFCGYTKDIHDNMRSDALYYMFKYMKSYNPEYYIKTGKTPNPFSYFTMVAWNGFIQNIKKFHKINDFLVPISYIENCCENEETLDKVKIYMESQEKVKEINSLEKELGIEKTNLLQFIEEPQEICEQ